MDLGDTLGWPRKGAVEHLSGSLHPVGAPRGRFMGNSNEMVSNLMKRYSTLCVKFRTMILILGCLVHEFKIF